MEHRPPLGRLNIIPHLNKGATSKIKVFAANEWEESRIFERVYERCDWDNLFRLQVGLNWYWPRPGDGRYAFMTREELWYTLSQIIAPGLGIEATEIHTPGPRILPRTQVSILADDDIRTRSMTMTAPIFENGIWWVKVVGCKLPVPCNAINFDIKKRRPAPHP